MIITKICFTLGLGNNCLFCSKGPMLYTFSVFSPDFSGATLHTENISILGLQPPVNMPGFCLLLDLFALTSHVLENKQFGSKAEKG